MLVAHRPTGMFLGTVAPSSADLARVVDERRRRVAAKTAGMSRAQQIAERHDLLPLRDYLRAVAKFEKYEKEQRTRVHDPEKAWKYGTPSPALLGFLKLGERPEFTPDDEGWIAYLRTVAPAIAEELRALHRPSAFPEEGRQEHTLIIAETGHGKSELIKALAFHYVQHPTAAVVMLDPGGDLVRQIARWPELIRSDRLVYVEPEWEPGKAVGFNPLDGSGLDARSRNQVAGVLGIALGEGSSELTSNMETLVKHCATVLLSLPGTNLADLRNLLEVSDAGRGASKGRQGAPSDPRTSAILAAANSYWHPEVRDFFQRKFDGEAYVRTRKFLGPRIDAMLADHDVYATLIGPATLNLEAAIDARKVVLVNLNKFGDPNARAALGRFLVATVAGIGQRRGQLPDGASRVPVHLFVDEVSTMVTPQMVVVLNELRKFGIHATFAQQVGGAGFTPEQREALFTNTACKLVAYRDRREGAAMLTEPEPDALPKLAKGQFWTKWQGVDGVRTLTVRSDLLGYAHAVGDSEWQDFKRRSIADHYRDAHPAQEASWEAAESPPAARNTPTSPKASKTPPRGAEADLAPSEPPPGKRKVRTGILNAKPKPK